jgi:hypothetical protein
MIKFYKFFLKKDTFNPYIKKSKKRKLMKKVAVLSRYKEDDNTWHDMIAQSGYDIIVYDKYEGENLLPNVGREGHTYIHHIIENYDDLPDEILFSQYDPRDHFRKKEERMQSFLNCKLLHFSGINATDFDKRVREREILWKSLSRKLFGNFQEKEVYKLIACGSTLNGVFKVSKEAILKHNVALYERALEMLSGEADPDEGYFFERMWKFLFIQTGCKDPAYKDIIEDKIFKFGSIPALCTRAPRHVKWKDYNFGHIKFSKDGTITSNGNVSYYHHRNESHWVLFQDYLYILDDCGSITSRFRTHEMAKKINSGNVILGDFASLDETGEWHTNSARLSRPFWEFY